MNYTPLLPKLRRKDKSQDDEISRRFFFFFLTNCSSTILFACVFLYYNLLSGTRNEKEKLGVPFFFRYFPNTPVPQILR